METVQWKVDGMDCNTCAINIHKYLEKNGMKNVKVNYATGDVIFDISGNISTEKLSSGIRDLGYTVMDTRAGTTLTANKKPKFLSTHLQRFWFCFPFTALLMLHMIPAVHHSPYLSWLMNHWIQLALTIPVYAAGMSFFGKSALKSIRNGVPNMNDSNRRNGCIHLQSLWFIDGTGRTVPVL